MTVAGLTIVLAACSQGTPAVNVSPVETPAQATPAANNPDPCTMATPAELKQATRGVEFIDGVKGTIPGVPPIASCEWDLVAHDPTVDTHGGYVLIAFMPYGLDKARIVDSGHDATFAGHPGIVGSGNSNGVASIDAGNGTVLRVEMTLGPGPSEYYNVLTKDVMQDVGQAAASHL